MPVPDFQMIMLPFLQLVSDGNEWSSRMAIDGLAEQFGLTKEEREELLPSGHQQVIDNRVGWAKTYMTKAGLLESPRRGYTRITPAGLEVCSRKPAKIDVKFLEQFPNFVEFRTIRKKDNGPSRPSIQSMPSSETPEEEIETAYQTSRDSLASELLLAVQRSSPSFFERLVVELIVKMGYGGTREDAGRALGRSGDEGIDGIIKEDLLGLDVVYLQAKRWEGVVGRPEIQKFAGALQGQRARKGIFITTGYFSREAKDFASRIESTIVLIDGSELAQHMIDFDLGVTRINTYELKRIDTDYFPDS